MILTKYVTDKYYSAIYSIENKLKSHRKDHSITTICFNSTRLTNMKYSNSSYYSFAHKRVQIENLAHLTCEIFMWTILCSLSPNRHRIHLPGGTRDNGRRSIPTNVFHTPNTICHSASRAVLVPVERSTIKKWNLSSLPPSSALPLPLPPPPSRSVEFSQYL